MIWQNPWAWTGAALLVLPVLIHLLSKAPARLAPFPSLRFVTSSRLMPRRRTRVRDVLLLLVRLATLACAVAALAHPLLSSASRRATATRAVRAIVVDTSLSMRAPVAGTNRRAADSARALAKAEAAGAAAAMILETDRPAESVAAAAAWMTSQTGTHELVVLSDFQRGALDARSLQSVPALYGVRLIALRAMPPRFSTPPTVTGRGRAADTAAAAASFTVAAAAPAMSAVVAPSETDTRIAWTSDSVPTADRTGVLVAPAVRIVNMADSAHTESGTATAAAQGELPRQAWMSNLVLRLRSDEVLQELARGATVVENAAASSLEPTDAKWVNPSTSVVVARNAHGTAVVRATAMRDGADTVLTLLDYTTAGSATSAVLQAAVDRARVTVPPISEHEPLVETAATLRAWSRTVRDTNAVDALRARSNSAALQDGATTGDSQSDARWLWLSALVLLALEWALRRRSDRTIAEALDGSALADSGTRA